MSRSIHITIKNFRGLTENELNTQFNDPHSDLSIWAKKKVIKKQIKAIRKNKKRLSV